MFPCIKSSLATRLTLLGISALVHVARYLSELWQPRKGLFPYFRKNFPRKSTWLLINSTWYQSVACQLVRISLHNKVQSLHYYWKQRSTISSWTFSYQSLLHYKLKKYLIYPIQVTTVIWRAIRLAKLIQVISEVHLVNYHSYSKRISIPALLQYWWHDPPKAT